MEQVIKSPVNAEPKPSFLLTFSFFTARISSQTMDILVSTLIFQFHSLDKNTSNGA